MIQELRSRIEFYREGNPGRDHRARVLLCPDAPDVMPPLSWRTIGRVSEGYEDRIDAKAALRHGLASILLHLGSRRMQLSLCDLIRELPIDGDIRNFFFTVRAANGEKLLVQGPVEGLPTRTVAERDLLRLASALLAWMADGEAVE